MEYTYITEHIEDSLLTYLANRKFLGLDTETTGLDQFTDRLRLIQLSTEDKKVFIFDHFTLEREILKLQKVLHNKMRVIGHNLKFEFLWLWSLYREYGECLDLSNVQICFDTQLANQIIHNGKPDIKNSLAAITQYYLDIPISKEMQVSDWGRKELTQEQLKYAAKDVLYLHDLRNKMVYDEIVPAGLLDICKLEFSYLPVASALEYNGIYINLDKVNKVTEEVEKKLDKETQKLYTELPDVFYQPSIDNKSGYYSINAQSKTKQLRPKLIELGFNTDTLDVNVLKNNVARFPVCKTLVNISSYNKMLGTYLRKFSNNVSDVTNRFHPNYNQLGTITGRFTTYGGVSILTIPRDPLYRNFFDNSFDEDYVICNCDYSNIEGREVSVDFFADISSLRTLFNEDKDVYVYTAARVVGMTYDQLMALKNTDPKRYKEVRTLGKVMVLSLNYGMGVDRYQNTKVLNWSMPCTREEAEKERDIYFELFPELRVWHRKCYNKWKKSDFYQTINGRRIWWDKEGKGIYNKSINLSVQSLCTYFFKQAQIGIFYDTKNYFIHPPLFDRCPFYQTLYVHDEFGADVKREYQKYAKNTIERNMLKYANDSLQNQVKVVAEASFGNSWGEAH